MIEHKQGCDALGGYGHGVGPCTCGAVAPVEAQAVPDQPVAKWHELKTDPDVFDAVASGAKTHEIRYDDRDFAVGDGLLLRRTRDTGWAMKNTGAPLVYTGEECRRVVSHVLRGYGLEPGWVILSLRPTPAAADLHRKLLQLKPPKDMQRGTSDLAAAYRAGFSACRHAAAQLVAASPAAAADTFQIPRKLAWSILGLLSQECAPCAEPECRISSNPEALITQCREELYAVVRPSSPVAPVGAPTRLLTLPELAKLLADASDVPFEGEWHLAFCEAIQRKFCEVNGIRQGCELATDATKQLREHSVHLAATPIDQDFRRRPASSEAAPSDEGSDGLITTHAGWLAALKGSE